MTTERARRLRREQTDVEAKLWSRLRNRQLDGWKFKRQVPKRAYIVDFFCADAKLIIELDGGQHTADKAVAYDAERTRYLQACGFRVIRFWNHEVFEDIDAVLDTIWRKLQEPSLPASAPHSLSPEGVDWGWGPNRRLG